MEINILGVKINCLNKKSVLEKIDGFLDSNDQHHIITTNPEFILEAQIDQEFKNIINKASLSVADGMGVRMAGKYLSIRIKNKLVAFFQGLKIGWWGIFERQKLDVIPEVITGVDLIPEICRLLELRIKNKELSNNKVFLLGGYGETPRLVAEKLKDRFGGLEFEYSVFEIGDVVLRINKFEPSVLFVALNHPRAQKWIDNNLDKIPGIKVAVGVGGAFDYISGKVKRAPCFLRKIGLEWLYRLFRQPIKRTKRIYDAAIRFPWIVYRNGNLQKQ